MLFWQQSLILTVIIGYSDCPGSRGRVLEVQFYFGPSGARQWLLPLEFLNLFNQTLFLTVQQTDLIFQLLNHFLLLLSLRMTPNIPSNSDGQRNVNVVMLTCVSIPECYQLAVQVPGQNNLQGNRLDPRRPPHPRYPGATADCFQSSYRAGAGLEVWECLDPHHPITQNPKKMKCKNIKYTKQCHKKKWINLMYKSLPDHHFHQKMWWTLIYIRFSINIHLLKSLRLSFQEAG